MTENAPVSSCFSLGMKKHFIQTLLINVKRSQKSTRYNFCCPSSCFWTCSSWLFQVICLSTNQKLIFTCTWSQRKSGHFQALDSIYSAYSKYPTDQKDIKVRSHWQWWCNSWRWPSCCSIGHKQAFLLEYCTQLYQRVNHLSSALIGSSSHEHVQLLNIRSAQCFLSLMSPHITNSHWKWLTSCCCRLLTVWTHLQAFLENDSEGLLRGSRFWTSWWFHFV